MDKRTGTGYPPSGQKHSGKRCRRFRQDGVLVERILSRVTDPGHPTDIDRLLVVTFTKAAAGEMKERIGRALEQALLEDPDNEHLQRQGTLLHHARISTIHGFCNLCDPELFSPD